MVTLVNCFEVPAGREEEFFSMWQQVNTYMHGKKGYLEHKLHRSLAPDARFRFINVACWASQADFDAAHDDGFRALVTKPEWSAFRPFPSLYEVVHEGKAGS
ncbi:MAG: antibiotic biosynthesis monooxygenase [Acidobacteria bacterium]|nr:MAG: antibiotic biosynthesis monooxygenase [Acidobacteriota bacterium]